MLVRRVRRPDTKTELLEQLVDREEGVFETYKDALVFAAALAASRNASKPFEKSGEPIDYTIFARNGDQESLFYLLAVYNKGDLQLLADARANERLTVFEEYAHAGLEIIDLERTSSRRSIRDVVLKLVSDAQRSDSTSSDVNLENLVDEIGGLLSTSGGLLSTSGKGHEEK